MSMISLWYMHPTAMFPFLKDHGKNTATVSPVFNSVQAQMLLLSVHHDCLHKGKVVKLYILHTSFYIGHGIGFSIGSSRINRYYLTSIKNYILTTDTMAEITQTWKTLAIHHECHHEIIYTYGDVTIAPSHAEIILEPSEIWDFDPARIRNHFYNKLNRNIDDKNAFSSTRWAPYEETVC